MPWKEVKVMFILLCLGISSILSGSVLIWRGSSRSSLGDPIPVVLNFLACILSDLPKKLNWVFISGSGRSAFRELQRGQSVESLQAGILGVIGVWVGIEGGIHHIFSSDNKVLLFICLLLLHLKLNLLLIRNFMQNNQQSVKSKQGTPEEIYKSKNPRSRQSPFRKPIIPSLAVHNTVQSEMISPKDIIPMSMLLQQRPSTSQKNFDFVGQVRKNQTQGSFHKEQSQASHRTASKEQVRSKHKSTNRIHRNKINIMKPCFSTVNMNFQFSSHGHPLPDPTVSSQIARKLDIEVDSNSDMKTIKHSLAALISQYKRAVKDYTHKLQDVTKFINHLSYDENLRTLADFQELFRFCKDKIEISQEVIMSESQIFEKRKELELQNIELSNVKNKLQKTQQMLKKTEQENKDLKKQVLRGIEDVTSLYKTNVQQQSSTNSMKKKVEELEQGLKTLSMNGNEDNQSRLKTTIHLLILENNSLKKELSLMQNQGDEQVNEIERLKKKINHLVIKIDAQRKEKDTITRRLTNKYISDINFLQFNSPSPEKKPRASLAVPQTFKPFRKQAQVHEEFELIEDKGEVDQAKLELNKLIHSDKNNFLTKSNFNLQGPYWKNRTNKILKQEQILRDAFKEEKNLENQIFQFPHLRKRENRYKRLEENFKLSYLNSDQSKTLREVQEMGTNNFVESIMSLRALDIKKNLETITREYQQRNTLFRLQMFLLGEAYDFFFSKMGNPRQLIRNVNHFAQKVLKVKEAKVWFRDIMNNYIWTVNFNDQYESVDLTQNDEISNLYSNILQSPLNVGSTLGQDLCLYVPIADYTQEYCLGFVQFSLPNDYVREDGYEFGFEQQLGAQIISEYMSLILDKDLKEKSNQYIIRKRELSIQVCVDMLKQEGIFPIYKFLEQSLLRILDIDRIKILLNKDGNTYTITKDENLTFSENTDSIMTYSLHLPKAIIVFMPYSHPSYNVKIDLDSQMPLNIIQLKSVDGDVFGAIQYENKMVKNRSDPNFQVVAFQDEGVIQVVQNLSSFLYLALFK